MIRIVCPHVRGVGRAWVVISKTPAEPVKGLPRPARHGMGAAVQLPPILIQFQFRSLSLTVGQPDLLPFLFLSKEYLDKPHQYRNWQQIHVV